MDVSMTTAEPNAVLDKKQRNSTERSLAKSVGHWLMRLARNTHDEVLNSRELQSVARELSMSPSEFYALAARNNQNSSELLDYRLSHLELSKSEIANRHGKVLQDLQRVCANCNSTAECARDFAKKSTIPDFPDYCPNDQTLRAIKQQSTLRRIESNRGPKQS